MVTHRPHHQMYQSKHCLHLKTNVVPLNHVWKIWSALESRFSQLSEREQRLVGVDKVLMFMKSVDRRERMAISLKLEEDDDANGLIEDWRKVESLCRLHDKGQARISTTTTRTMRDDGRVTRCGDPPTTKEMKRKVEIKPRRMVIEEEETSQQIRVNVVADTKAQVRYEGLHKKGKIVIILSLLALHSDKALLLFLKDNVLVRPPTIPRR